MVFKEKRYLRSILKRKGKLSEEGIRKMGVDGIVIFKGNKEVDNNFRKS